MFGVPRGPRKRRWPA